MRNREREDTDSKSSFGKVASMIQTPSPEKRAVATVATQRSSAFLNAIKAAVSSSSLSHEQLATASPVPASSAGVFKNVGKLLSNKLVLTSDASTSSILPLFNVNSKSGPTTAASTNTDKPHLSFEENALEIVVLNNVEDGGLNGTIAPTLIRGSDSARALLPPKTISNLPIDESTAGDIELTVFSDTPKIEHVEVDDSLRETKSRQVMVESNRTSPAVIPGPLSGSFGWSQQNASVGHLHLRNSLTGASNAFTGISIGPSNRNSNQSDAGRLQKRRSSGWRLFDGDSQPKANSDNENSDSNAKLFGQSTSGFIISKSSGEDKRFGLNPTRLRTVMSLPDSPRKKSSRQSTMSSPQTTQQVISNFQTLTNSVGELITSVFRGPLVVDKHHQQQLQHMSPFEIEMRGLGTRIGGTTSSNENISNLSLKKVSTVDGTAPSGPGRRSTVSSLRHGELDFDRQSLIDAMPARNTSIRSRTVNDVEHMSQLMDSVIKFTLPNGRSPVSVFSVRSAVEIYPKKDKRRKPMSLFGSQAFGDRLGVVIEGVKRRPKVESYQRYIEPTFTLGSAVPDYSIYDPLELDDPELKTGKHRTVIKLQSYVSSILLYSRPADIKKELNEVFRETHPNVDPYLTLSQIRNLKMNMIEVGKQQNMEMSSVAVAFVYFEKLVVKNYATKENRKLIAAVCLLLAAKINDPKELKYTDLLETIERVMEISPREVFQQEFGVFVALEFTLFVPVWQFMPHMERIMEAIVASSSTLPNSSETLHNGMLAVAPDFRIRGTSLLRFAGFIFAPADLVLVQEETDPKDILGTVLIDPMGRHAVRIVSVIGTGSFAHVYMAETVPIPGAVNISTVASAGASVSSASIAGSQVINGTDTSSAHNESHFEPEKRAVKRLFKAGLDERQLLLQRQEAEVMKAMAPHPNIIQLLATVEDQDCLYLIMEFCELGEYRSSDVPNVKNFFFLFQLCCFTDLYEAITQQGGFPEDVVKEVFVQIADSVLHCHNSGFYHRDLKPENCLISTANYKVKLADFGLTTTDEWSTELGCGSVRYMAPECFELNHNSSEGSSGQPVPPPVRSLPVPAGVINGGYSPVANDVWALGVILLNLLFGKNPWFEAHMSDAIFSAFASKHWLIQFNLTLQFDAVLRRVFELDPRRRCSVLDLKLMVEGVSKFVEDEPIANQLAQQQQLQQQLLRQRRRGRNSILAGPGYILKPGDPFPSFIGATAAISPAAESSEHATAVVESPRKILKQKQTYPSLKAVVNGGDSKDDGLELSGDENIASTNENDRYSRDDSAYTDTIAGDGVKAIAAENGSTIVPNGVDHPSSQNASFPASVTGVPAGSDSPKLSTASANGRASDVENIAEADDAESDDDVRQEDQDSLRKAMQAKHVERMMRIAKDDEIDGQSVDDSLIVRERGDGSLKGTVASSFGKSLILSDTEEVGTIGPKSVARKSVGESGTLGRKSVIEDTATVEAKSERKSVLPSDEAGSSSANSGAQMATPSWSEADAQLQTGAYDITMKQLPPRPKSFYETENETGAIRPPSMERHDSNPYVPPRANTTQGIHTVKPKRSSTPLKWFVPFISRDSARVDRMSSASPTHTDNGMMSLPSVSSVTSSHGRVGLFGVRKKMSSRQILQQRQGQHAEEEGDSSAGERKATPRPSFGMLRKRRSVILNRHVSAATNSTAVNLESPVPEDDSLAIEEDDSRSSYERRLPVRRSTLSLKELSIGFRDAFNIGRKRSGLAVEEVTE
ncbi:hypothetical protein HDU83_004850 [Entophlyctis luteolus]|nr:hypothetical protein HDU83_004850 [Entophlyctis luteolus]